MCGIRSRTSWPRVACNLPKPNYASWESPRCSYLTNRAFAPRSPNVKQNTVEFNPPLLRFHSMYENHWQLERRPFENNNSDVRFYYPGESHQGALLKLRYAVENRRPAALLS